MVIGGLKRMEMIRTMPELKAKLWENVNKLQAGLRERGFNIGNPNSPVTPVYMESGVTDATQLVVDLRENYNIFCSMVMYPVIPKGQLILRLIPTAIHTDEDIQLTLEAFTAVREKVEKQLYPKEIPQVSNVLA
jgi:glycine C-acetyltransferase